MIFIASITIFILACNSKKDSTGLTDLLPYGIPYKISAPKDASITKIGQGRIVDVSVKNNSGYDLQVFMTKAYTTDINKIKTEKKTLEVINPSFGKIVEEYDDGYLYEKNTDAGKRTYDFWLIKIVGDNEINFQCGNSREFSEQEVRNILLSIRN